MKDTLLILCYCLLIIACRQSNQNQSVSKNNVTTLSVDTSIVIDASLLSLIANPGDYNGRKLRVIGYLHLEFEGNELFLHKDDYTNSISKNAIWVDVKIKHPESSKLNKFTNHYVLIEGIFDGSDLGHMSMNSGSIKNITRLEMWPHLLQVNAN